MASYYPPCSPSEVSIADALTKLGADGSYSNRKKIAIINGISDYKGTAQQNIHLLNLLKQGKLIKEKNESESSPKKEENNLNNEDNSTYGQMLQNIQNSGQFGNKSDALIKIGELLFKKGYKKAFIAGLLANIYHEGNFGYFESSKYVKNPGAKPGYLKIMDEKYDYANKYSGKCVTEVSLTELKNLIDELQNNNWKNGKFGLGVIQWTGGRTAALVNLYLEVANGNNYINMDQVILAEGKMLISELNSNQYKNIYENWKENNNNDIDSENAAYDAGAKICQKYEIPYDTQNQAIKRGNTAKNIYRIMIQ